jgi:ankyrin repeat protein
VQLLPFGSGLPAVAQLLQDGAFSSSNSHLEALEERMELMACVVAAVTDEGSAADQARAVMQSPGGPSALLEQTDHVGRTPLHLAAAQGRRLLVTALLSGPAETRKAAACARDLRGRTPLHYCSGEHVAMTLLQANADPSLVDEHGCGPLHVNRDPNVADRLVKAKTHGATNDASPDLRDKVRSLRLSKHPAPKPSPFNSEPLCFLPNAQSNGD